MIAQLQNANYLQGMNQGNQATTLAQIIPTMAWNRLMGAANQVQQTNPTSLLSLMNSFQNTGTYNSNQFYGRLSQLLMQLANSGMFG